MHIHTVHLRTDRTLLWRRIQQRLALEPQRLALREDKMEWMDAVLSFYDTMRWDITVANNEVAMTDLVLEVLGTLASMSSDVQAVLRDVAPHLESCMPTHGATPAAMALFRERLQSTGVTMELEGLSGVEEQEMLEQPSGPSTPVLVRGHASVCSPGGPRGSEYSHGLTVSPAVVSAPAQFSTPQKAPLSLSFDAVASPIVS